MTPLTSDVRLARQAGDGDRRAFEAIFKRYHQDLYRFCLSIVGRPEDAQDALQNTMVKALRALPGERREIQLKPWLYRVAHNESIDLLRRRREGPELDGDRASAGAEIAETVALRERLERLLIDLDELSERQRSALVMRELGGLDYEQIGAALDSSPAVARQTVYEARLGLRELETGREMSCEQVTRQLSDADGRVARRRDIRAHLRACPECRAFRDSIDSRRRDLAALAPLPAVAAASILQGLLGGKVAAGSGIGGAATAAGAGAGKAAGTSVAVKAVATVAVVATVGVTAADRGGLVDVGLPGRGANDGGKSRSASGSGTLNRTVGSRDGSTAGRNGSGARETRRAGIGTATSATGHGHGGSSSHPAKAAPQDQPNGGKGGGDGSPTAKFEASRHGRETAAEHKATGKGKSKGHPAHPPHPGSPPHAQGAAQGGQGNGKAESKGQTPQPTESEATKSHPVPAEPPGQAKGKVPAEAGAEQGQGKAKESEPSS